MGPFTAKNFATSISPWIVSLDALEPFRCCSSAGPVQNDPEPLPYLIDPHYDQDAYDVKLEVLNSHITSHIDRLQFYLLENQLLPQSLDLISDICIGI